MTINITNWRPTNHYQWVAGEYSTADSYCADLYAVIWSSRRLHEERIRHNRAIGNWWRTWSISHSWGSFTTFLLLSRKLSSFSLFFWSIASVVQALFHKRALKVEEGKRNLRVDLKLYRVPFLREEVESTSWRNIMNSIINLQNKAPRIEIIVARLSSYLN